MKKNVILLVVDSMGTKHFEMFPEFNELFLSKLIKKGVFFDNVYSQGPYTEAALMGLLSGQETLDYNGYLRNFADSPNTLFDVFHKNGYRTYRTNQLPHMYESSYERGVTDMRYISTPSVANLYDYRFNYYKKKRKKKKFSQKDNDEIKAMLKEHFYYWKKFCCDLLEKKESMDIIIDSIDLDDVVLILEQVKKEEIVFLSDEDGYIKRLLSSKYGDFSLSQIKRISYSPLKDILVPNKVIDKLLEIKKRTDLLQKELNSKNKIPIGLVLEAMKNFVFHPCMETAYDIYKFLFSIKSIRKIQKNETRFGKNFMTLKESPSCYKIVKNLLSFVDKTNEPFFAYVHLEDLHLPTAVFTSDYYDEEMFSAEINDIEKTISLISKDFKGDILTPISLKYIDRKIEYLFSELEKRNKLDNTIVMITADHGHSFYGNPVKKTTFRASFNHENYRIPVIIYSKNIVQTVNHDAHSSFSIPKTLTDLAGLEAPDNFHSDSLFASGQKITILEYAGAGCPDIDGREMFFCAFNEEFSISLKGMIGKQFTKKNIYSIIDLKKDPDQIHPLRITKKNFAKIKPLFDYLEQRRISILEGRKNY